MRQGATRVYRTPCVRDYFSRATMARCSASVMPRFSLNSDGGPLAFRHERPRQPIHVHTEVVPAPEINIVRDRPHLQNFKMVSAFVFNDDLRQQRDERLVLAAFPAVLVRPCLVPIHDSTALPPCPGGDAVVAARQIRPWQSGDQHRLAFGNYSWLR